MTHLTKDLDHCRDICNDCQKVCQDTFSYCLDWGGRFTAAKRLVRLLDCVAICGTSAELLSRRSDLHDITCSACAAICDRCADSCEEIGDDEMMQRCAQACRHCAESCRHMAGALAA